MSLVVVVLALALLMFVAYRGFSVILFALKAIPGVLVNEAVTVTAHHGRRGHGPHAQGVVPGHLRDHAAQDRRSGRRDRRVLPHGTRLAIAY